MEMIWGTRRFCDGISVESTTGDWRLLQDLKHGGFFPVPQTMYEELVRTKYVRSTGQTCKLGRVEGFDADTNFGMAYTEYTNAQKSANAQRSKDEPVVQLNVVLDNTQSEAIPLNTKAYVLEKGKWRVGTIQGVDDWIGDSDIDYTYKIKLNNGRLISPNPRHVITTHQKYFRGDVLQFAKGPSKKKTWHEWKGYGRKSTMLGNPPNAASIVGVVTDVTTVKSFPGGRDVLSYNVAYGDRTNIKTFTSIQGVIADPVEIKNDKNSIMYDPQGLNSILVTKIGRAEIEDLRGVLGDKIDL